MGYLELADELLTVTPGLYNDAHWGLLHEFGHNHQVGGLPGCGFQRHGCLAWRPCAGAACDAIALCQRILAQQRMRASAFNKSWWPHNASPTLQIGAMTYPGTGEVRGQLHNKPVTSCGARTAGHAWLLHAPPHQSPRLHQTGDDAALASA